jgi:hypothetical protein
MQPPDFNGRKEIFELYLAKVKAAADIDIDRLARMTSGYTGADIANLVNQATMVAGLKEAKFVDMTHLEHAREKIIMGIIFYLVPCFICYHTRVMLLQMTFFSHYRYSYYTKHELM